MADSTNRCTDSGVAQLTRSYDHREHRRHARDGRDASTGIAACQRARLGSVSGIAASLARSFPIVWISVRTGSRRPLNQTGFIIELCERVLTTYSNAAILVDGHSYPEDISENDNYDRRYTSECIANDSAEADRIIGAVLASGCCGESQAILKVVGLSILNSIYLADRAHFYVCNHGTVQHKIGWLTDVSGVVHSNPRTIGIDPGPWVALQTEASGTVRYFDAELVRAADQEQSEESEELRSRLMEDYEFADIGKSVDFVLARLQTAIELRPSVIPKGGAITGVMTLAGRIGTGCWPIPARGVVSKNTFW